MNAAASAPLLELEGVSKGFPGVQALDEVHLELRLGEVHALVGENGAGKSTLMKLLSGIDTPDAGVFRLNGHELVLDGPRHAQELGISDHPPGVQPDARPHGRAEHLHRPRATGGGHLPRRPCPEPADAGAVRAARAWRSTRRNPSSELTVARQQMVEIAKALSLRREGAHHGRADRGAERRRGRRALRAHPPLRHPTPASSTSRTAWTSCRSITDRITVLRDGRYIDTLDTAVDRPARRSSR